MGSTKSLLRGIAAFVVTTVAVRAVGGERLDARIGLLAGGAVAAWTWLSGRRDDTEVEPDAEASVAE